MTEWASPFSQRPFAATSSRGHLLQQKVDVPIFPVRGVDPVLPSIRVFRHPTDASVILSLLLGTFCWEK